MSQRPQTQRNPAYSKEVRGPGARRPAQHRAMAPHSSSYLAYSINPAAVQAIAVANHHMQQPPQATPSPSPYQLQQSQTGNPSGSIPQQPQNMTLKIVNPDTMEEINAAGAVKMSYVRRPRSNQLKIVNPDTMEEINAAGPVSVVSNHLFDGLELSKHLKSLFSKQGIEDCFLFFSYSIGLMCRFVAFMLLKYQVCPSQTSKVMI